MTSLVIYMITIGFCILEIDSLKCACGKIKTHVFIVNDDDNGGTTKHDFLDPGQCLELAAEHRRFWVAVSYSGKNAFLQSHEVIIMDCQNDLISFTPRVMNAIYNCSGGKNRKTVTGMSYLPLDDTYYDEHDMPLTTLQNFVDRSQKYVSVFIEESLGVNYGSTICIPELNQMYQRLIIFRVANTYRRKTKMKDSASILYDDGVNEIIHRLTLVLH
ncbi:uncharacterized protein LOC132551307 [Ylistrum balloti]|uniref:uncharacterized protein LOC132551307 n=1 Tax=Ylistrum balloti TaxID=509963 RepID=UPI002905A8D2|nr:uncharacterized protein LOC132551307 [Ylistrum balloti]